jgi:hypothetical protein
MNRGRKRKQLLLEAPELVALQVVEYRLRLRIRLNQGSLDLREE